MPPKVKKKLPENICSIFLKNKGAKIINITRILWDTEILKSLPKSSIKFLMLTVTNQLTPTLFYKVFNFNNFVYDLDLDVFY